MVHFLMQLWKSYKLMMMNVPFAGYLSAPLRFLVLIPFSFLFDSFFLWICKPLICWKWQEPMAKAKKLSCNHLFHLACLRSWYGLVVAWNVYWVVQIAILGKIHIKILQNNYRLDQGLTENYSCPTCRKPLFIGRSENEVNPQTVDVRGDELLAREMSMGLDQLNLPGHALQNEASRNQMHNPLESSDWRSVFLYHSRWLLLTHLPLLISAKPASAVEYYIVPVAVLSNIL